MKPKKVFLIDGIGATLTAIILITVLNMFNETFGLPLETMTILAIIAVLLAIYSLSCFEFLQHNTQMLLKIIIVANLIYCILTLGVVIHYYNSIKILGLLYFVGEMVIIFSVICIELKTLKQIDKTLKRLI